MNLRRRSRLSRCTTMDDLVRGGFARAVNPASTAGWLQYGTGREMLPELANLYTDPRCATGFVSGWGAGVTPTRETEPPQAMLNGMTACTKLVHESGAWITNYAVDKATVIPGDVVRFVVQFLCVDLAGADLLLLDIATLNSNTPVRSDLVPAYLNAALGYFYTSVSGPVTIEAGENQVSLRAVIGAGTGVYYVTQLALMKDTATYADGSTAGWEWSGAVDASTSIRPESSLIYTDLVTIDNGGATAAGTNVAYARNSAGDYYGPVVVTPTAKSAGVQTAIAAVWHDPVAVFNLCTAGDYVIPLNGDTRAFLKL